MMFDVGNLPWHCNFLQAVVKEILRLHAPTAMGIPHSNVDDATLGGYHIPAGTSVMPNLWALHRDPMTWGDDALAFNPDRFLASDLSVNGTNYQYLPFGAGRRSDESSTLYSCIFFSPSFIVISLFLDFTGVWVRLN
jgi:cytochrome P450